MQQQHNDEVGEQKDKPKMVLAVVLCDPNLRVGFGHVQKPTRRFCSHIERQVPFLGVFSFVLCPYHCRGNSTLKSFVGYNVVE